MVFFQSHGIEEKEFFHWMPLTEYQFPLHFHRAYELVIVRKGKLVVTISHVEYTLEPNQLIFIFSNHTHDMKTVGESEVTIILFSPDLIGDFFTDHKGWSPNNPVLKFDQLPDLEKLDSIYKQKAFLYQLCGELIDQTEFIKVESSTKTRLLHKILLFVDENYQTNCSLKDVAKHLRYDYPYLSKLFVQITNMTFTDYLNNYRISQACYLLKNSGISVGEIATQCGYNQLRTFHRNFREIIGKSPKQYRESR